MKKLLFFIAILCASVTLSELAAQQLVGVPYVGATLEPAPLLETLETFVEPLVVNLEGVDCTTYVEYITAARLAGYRPHKEKDLSAVLPSDSLFLAKLQALRYRGGQRGNYATRKHYFSEWISDAEAQGFLADVTSQMKGATPLCKKIDFMSQHPQFYPQLQKSEALLHEVQKVEQQLSADTIYYIPKEKIANAHAQLKDGDIVAFLTNKDGLDIQHVGFVWKPTKKSLPRLLHASTTHKCVTVDKRTISQYAMAQKSVCGIRIIRIK